MIIKINKIKDFAIFRNFTWNNTIDDFKKFNFIYGWNYSGKTTLSRIFRCFETQKLNDKYPDAKFELEIDNGKKYDESQLDKITNIRVFNDDFKKDNLIWEEYFEPILLIGEENIQLQNQLQTEKNKLNNNIIEKDKLVSLNENAMNGIESSLTDKAREIKILLSLPDYTKSNLRPEIAKILADPNKFILINEELQNNITTYRSTEKKDLLTEIKLEYIDFSTLKESISLILNSTVQSKVIEKLKNNKELSDWVETGIKLHKNKTVCEFCGNKIPLDLISKLSEHFSDEYNNFIKSLDSKIKEIEINKIIITLPYSTNIYKEFKTEYNNKKIELETEISIYNKNLDGLISYLINKK